jgi:hypothetical protein
MADLTITTVSGKLVDVKIEKVKPIGAKEPTIIERNENGDLILKKRKTDTGVVFDAFKWITVDINGKEYAPKKINKFEVVDNKEVEVVFPPKTKRIAFSMDSVIPITYLGRLLPESQYEVFAVDSASIPALYEDIERAINADVAYYVNPFTWKSDTKKQYFAIFIPYITEDHKFGFTLMTSEGKIELHHAMEMPSGLTDKKDVKVIKTIGNLASLLEVK